MKILKPRNKTPQIQLNNIVDFHSHILFDIDDGPTTIEKSLKILDSEKQQNVSDILLTSHFYADTDDVNKFINIRQDRYEKLCAANQTGINLHLAAEVYLCRDLTLLSSVKDLCISGTDRILLEIPHEKEINSHILNLINQVASNYNVIPVIAHIDRYFDYIKYYRDVIDELIDLGCELQLNASALLERKTLKEARRLLENGCISYIGSDTHNTHKRKCNIAEGYSVIIDEFGKDVAEYLNMNAMKVLNK
ncbi:MAG: hypothetical protein IJF54_00305 [Clostridia bacterium]|nr:hypothetical protein [Clostridia bacterium]